MDEDLFTYEVEIPELANISCDLNEENYLEQRMTHGSDDVLELDPSNVEFTEWSILKFYNHRTMDWYIKNVLWIYWARGDDEVENFNKESLDPNDENLINENEVAKIFRIETNVFDFETPTCIAFKEFNYLLQIDLDVFTEDLEGFKTYD
nr:VIER F-box protein 2 [Tanacetum cinerariifolium]